MSGYGTCKWTCGECGESYEHGGVVGDLKVDRWARNHREWHRVQRMSTEERMDYCRRELEAHRRWPA